MKSPMRVDSRRFDARRDVDEHERAGEWFAFGLGDRGERRDAAERRADERGRLRRATAATARTSRAKASRL